MDRHWDPRYPPAYDDLIASLRGNDLEKRAPAAFGHPIGLHLAGNEHLPELPHSTLQAALQHGRSTGTQPEQPLQPLLDATGSLPQGISPLQPADSGVEDLADPLAAVILERTRERAAQRPAASSWPPGLLTPQQLQHQLQQQLPQLYLQHPSQFTLPQYQTHLPQQPLQQYPSQHPLLSCPPLQTLAPPQQQPGSPLQQTTSRLQQTTSPLQQPASQLDQPEAQQQLACQLQQPEPQQQLTSQLHQSELQQDQQQPAQVLHPQLQQQLSALAPSAGGDPNSHSDASLPSGHVSAPATSVGRPSPSRRLQDVDEPPSPERKRRPGRPIKYPDDANADHLSHAERSQIKRRIANRESARRVRRRKQGDVDALGLQVQAAQEREKAMQEHVLAVDKQYAALYNQYKLVHERSEGMMLSLERLQVDNTRLKEQLAFYQGFQAQHQPRADLPVSQGVVSDASISEPAQSPDACDNALSSQQNAVAATSKSVSISE